MKNQMKIWQVDSFTTKIFGGNPAGVMILQKDIADDLKQKIAMEMNLSETAFVCLGGETPKIQWFTPNSEVNLCGHATLAAGHILWSEGFIQTDKINFTSRSGVLRVHKQAEGYTLDFPTQPAVDKPDYTNLATEILGITPTYIGSNEEDFMAVVDDDQFLKSYQPNFDKMMQLPERRGFLLTAKDKSGEYDFIYRGFFPKLDVPEDPVTGSANTMLVPYWSKQLGKNKLRAYQSSKRGGELLLEMIGDRVMITGNAVTVFEALLPALEENNA